MRIDLHTHSSASDGTDAPAELMRAAARAGLGVVALTDHDSAAGWGEASAAVPETGVTLVPGVEVTTSAEGVSVHVLAYLPDVAEPGFAAMLADNRSLRGRRAAAMVERLGQDFPITWEDVVEQAGDPATVGRPHMADALVAAGVVPDRDHAFAQILSNDSPYYVHIEAPDPRDAVARIAAAGGASVMAHPFAAVRGAVVSDRLIADMADAGLRGLEAHHRDHSPAAAAHAEALAGDLGLLVTGSSDYHGSGKLNRLGESLTAPAVFEALTHGLKGVIRP